MPHRIVTALAVLPTAEQLGAEPAPRAAAVAAVTLRFHSGQCDAAFRTQVPGNAAGLQRWLDRLLADEPLLVGHRLGRTSVLLREAGYDRSLWRCVDRRARIDLCPRRSPRLSLIALAGAIGISAVDERALLCAAAPINGSTLAGLALVNATATAVICAARETRHRDDLRLLDAVMNGLAAASSSGPMPVAVRSMLPGWVQ